MTKHSANESKEIIYKLHKAVFLLDKISDQVLKNRLGLGLSQFLVLMALASQPKAPQKFVAKTLDQTQAAVSRQVDLLADAGLISRTKNPKSKREYVLDITRAGRIKLKQGQAEINRRYEKTFKIWTSQERMILLSCLNKLVRAMHASRKK